jgi:hypothetical protein
MRKILFLLEIAQHSPCTRYFFPTLILDALLRVWGCMVMVKVKAECYLDSSISRVHTALLATPTTLLSFSSSNFKDIIF